MPENNTAFDEYKIQELDNRVIAISDPHDASIFSGIDDAVALLNGKFGGYRAISFEFARISHIDISGYYIAVNSRPSTAFPGQYELLVSAQYGNVALAEFFCGIIGLIIKRAKFKGYEDTIIRKPYNSDPTYDAFVSKLLSDSDAIDYMDLEHVLAWEMIQRDLMDNGEIFPTFEDKRLILSNDGVYPKLDAVEVEELLKRVSPDSIEIPRMANDEVLWALTKSECEGLIAVYNSLLKIWQSDIGNDIWKMLLRTAESSGRTSYTARDVSSAMDEHLNSVSNV